MITFFTLLFLSTETIQELLYSISSIIILLSTIHIFQNLCFVICFQVIFNHLTVPLTLIGETILQGLVFISLSHQLIISALLVCLASPIQSRTENEGWLKRNVTSSPTALMGRRLSIAHIENVVFLKSDSPYCSKLTKFLGELTFVTLPMSDLIRSCTS